MSFLIDTNVISELRRIKPNPAVAAWFSGVPAAQLYLSALTVGEVRRGIELLRPKDAPRAFALEVWLSELMTTFHERVAPVTAEVAQEWGRLSALRTFPVVDGLIAATAKVNGWTLVTRNTKDVEGADVVVLNPFEWPVV